MSEIKKKPITTTNKGLVILAVVEAVIILVLFLSGFKKINPVLLLLVFAVAGIIIFFFLRKKKDMDLPEMIDMVVNTWYAKMKEPLNPLEAQGIPITPEITQIYFPYEGKTFEVNNRRITGLQVRHILNVVKGQEKSNVFREGIKYLGAEQKLKQRAEDLNIDTESLGL